MHVRVEPSRPGPIVIPEDGECGIASCSTSLPMHVTERQATAAQEFFARVTGLSCAVTLDARGGGAGVGSSVTIWRGAKGAIALGRRGFPAEEVGRTAARALLAEHESPGTVDIHLADQLLIYIAFYGGEYTTQTLSMHAETVCCLLSEFGYPVEYRENDIVEFSA